LGQVLEKKEQYEEAIAQLELAAKLDPTYPEPHYALARIYRKRRDSKTAEKELSLFQDLRNTDKLKGITRPD
jgi:Flp pilus assembly protein TadD